MKTTRKLTYHTDPAHGWLEVNRADLDALDISHRITPYSYEKGSSVYLEEDCDASLFMDTAKAAGWVFNITEAYADPSPVRSYARYQPRITPAALINAAQRLGKLHIVNITN